MRRGPPPHQVQKHSSEAGCPLASRLLGSIQHKARVSSEGRVPSLPVQAECAALPLWALLATPPLGEPSPALSHAAASAAACPPPLQSTARLSPSGETLLASHSVRCPSCLLPQ